MCWGEGVSIVILCHDRADATTWCLRGIREVSYRPLEVILVDNGSTDGTPALLQEFASFTAPSLGIECRVIRFPENAGCSTARNRGAAEAAFDVLVFMDNDVVTRTRRWVEVLLRELGEPYVAAVSPKLVYPVPPYRIQCAGGAVTRGGRVLFRGRGCERTDPRFDYRMDLQCAITACLMVRREVFFEVGMFDEIYNPVQFEDIDLCYKMRRAGYRLRYAPSAEMYHFEGSTTLGTSVRGRYLAVKHGLIFKERWKFMFSREKGPPDEPFSWRWPRLPRPGEVGEVEFVD